MEAGNTSTSAAGLVVVTGLPRSGTSLIMQMLRAGGWPLLCDDSRPPDESNPRGYYEYKPTLGIERDRSFLTGQRGRAVKIVAPLVRALAGDPFATLGLEPVRVVLVMRPLDDVLASQRRMLARLGKQIDPADEPRIREAFADALNRSLLDLENASHLELFIVTQGRLIKHPEEEAARMAGFLGPLPFESTVHPDIAAMAAAVDPSLTHPGHHSG